MNTQKLKNNKGIIIIILFLIVILAPLGYSTVSYIMAQETEGVIPFLERPDKKHKKCVRPVEYMRYHHWELLRGIREEIVRYGIRGEIGLSKCRQCHTNRTTFCDKCHNAVSLKPDCFGCHYYP
jgi:hypothetical protein